MKIRKYELLIALLLLLIFLFQSIVTLNSTSLTFDDPVFMTVGYYNLKYRDTSMLIFHPPLGFLTAGFPLLFAEVNLPYSYQECKYKGMYRCAQDTMFGFSNNPVKLGFYARTPFIVVSILFGILLFFFSTEMFGVKAGLFSLALYSFSPTILAFNTIALTDLMVAFFIFSAIYFFWKLVVQGYTKERLILTGISLGLALASKFTAVLLLPIIILILLVKVYEGKNRRKAFKKYSIWMSIILIIGFVTLHSTYFFNVDTVANTVPQRDMKHIDSFLEKKFEEGSFGEKAAKFLIFDLKVPMPDYWAGFIGQHLIGSSQLRKAYLNGQIYSGGKWYYFFEVLLIKTPIPLLIFFLISAFFLPIAKKWPLINELFVLLPVILFLGIFILINFNLGLRHILPIIPFIILFASRIVSIKLKNNVHNLLFRIFIGLLLVWYALSAVFIMPDYMAYFNEFVGMDNGHKYLLSSNLDQGQDIKRLAEYIKSNNIGRVKLSYHGTFDPSYYNISYELLPMESYIAWGPGYTLYDPPESYKENCSKKYGIITISVSNLHNFNLKNESCFSWLSSYKPIARIGYTIYVYNVTR